MFDVSQKAVSDFVGAHPSALATASAKAAAEGADALITMLPDGKIVRQAVLEGRDAAVEGLAPGAVVLDMSSSNPVDTQKLARDLAARGLALLDAPVSGGVKRAIDGSLSIMVGGGAADLERVRPVFGAMGKTITLCGPAGAGHALKALNNYLSAAGLVAMCEALVVGEAFGLDPGTMVDVFNSSTGKSNATEVKGRQFVVSRTFAAGFTTALMAKDLRTAGEVANASRAQHAQPAAGRGLLDRRRRQARQGRRPHRDLPLCREAGREGGVMGKAFTLDTTYINLRPDDSATTLKIDRRFWSTIEKRTDLDDGRLMGTTPNSRLGALGMPFRRRRGPGHAVG